MTLALPGVDMALNAGDYDIAPISLLWEGRSPLQEDAETGYLQKHPVSTAAMRPGRSAIPRT